jgi:alpha-pyrone synthase
MGPTLHAIGTAVPANRYPQPYVREVMGRWIGGERRADKLLDRVYRASAIDARHSVLDDFNPERNPERPALFFDAEGAFRSPSTGERNALYCEQAPLLAEQAAAAALAEAGDLRPSDVTHLITVSCTGFFTPGVDLHLQRALGLPRAVERYHLGFMGCFAAFPALRMADAFCRADPDAVVLIVTVELCTIHLQPDDGVDAILSGSVFADGAAAVLLSARPSTGPQRPLELIRSATALTEAGGDDMAWTIGDHGFDMTLTSYVPKVLEAEAHLALAPLFAGAPVAAAGVRWWAVHPGGRAIVDKVALGMSLGPEAIAASRAVLAENGNMSSATVLFVLRALMLRDQPGPAPGEYVASLAFGPGLTVDSALLRAL